MAKRYSEEGRARLLEAFRNSGQTQEAFCEANDLSQSTLGYWLRKARRDRGGDHATVQSPPPPPAVVEMALGAGLCGAVKIQLPSGVLIHCQSGQVGAVLAQIDQHQIQRRA